MGEYVLTKGFSPISIPSWKYLNRLIPQGISIAIIAFVITISMGKTFSRSVDHLLCCYCRKAIRWMTIKSSLLWVPALS